MKKALVTTFILFVLIALGVQAQNEKKTELDKNQFKTRIDLFTDIWQDTPEAFNSASINRGINIYSMYEFPIKNTSFSFQSGVGLGVHNLYFDNELKKNDEGIMIFSAIPDTLSNGTGVETKRSKISVAYLDIPIELKIRTENKLRAAIGFKLGYLINSLSKYKGDNYSDDSSSDITIKKKGIDGINNLRYGPTLRIGYKWIDISAYYSLTTLFEENKGPEMTPISIGISISKF
ncbi:MAG: outer membrane beta-barrel protein [Bacteroidota bacterium]|nr:outer membrane beta-barrel protein [Bacteroidota bacterium]